MADFCPNCGRVGICGTHCIERTEERKAGFARQIRDAKLALFIWRSPGCRHVDVRDLETDQIERALIHFEKRKQECRSELARRAGEPKPSFWTGEPVPEERGHDPERYA